MDIILIDKETEEFLELTQQGEFINPGAGRTLKVLFYEDKMKVMEGEFISPPPDHLTYSDVMKACIKLFS